MSHVAPAPETSSEETGPIGDPEAINDVIEAPIGDGTAAVAETTPNIVVPNPEVRRYAGAVLYIIAVVAGLAALFFGIFPEFGGDIANRALLFVNSAISFVSGAFGLAVTLPNVPKH